MTLARRNGFQSVVISVLISGLLGCSGGSSPESTSTSIGSSSQADGFAADPQFDSLVLDDNSYLLTTTNRDLYKISAATGAIELIKSFPRGAEMLGPTDVVGDVAFISAADNSLNAVELSTGNLIWETFLDEGIRFETPSAPVCSPDTCYVVGSANTLIALQVTDGSILWSAPLDQHSFAQAVAGNRPLLVLDEWIYVGVDYESGRSRLNIYSRSDGQRARSLDLSGRITSVPLEVAGKLLVTAGGDLVAIDQSTHQELWRTSFTNVSPPVAFGEVAVVTMIDYEGRYSAEIANTAGIEISSGEVIWVNETERTFAFNPKTDGALAITIEPYALAPPGVDRGFPRAVHPSDGRLIWDFRRDNTISKSTPLAVPGYLFFTSLQFVNGVGVGSLNALNGSGVTALDSKTGKVLWFERSSSRAIDINVSANQMILVHKGEVYRKNEFPTVSKQ